MPCMTLICLMKNEPKSYQKALSLINELYDHLRERQNLVCCGDYYKGIACV